MAKKLSISQLITLERLTQREYTLTGTPRKTHNRSVYDSDLLGIPREHHEHMRSIAVDQGSVYLTQGEISAIWSRIPDQTRTF